MADNHSILTTDKVTKQFGGLTAVDRVSIHINPGEIVGLIGPNGSGKTTLFNCISGFYPSTKGRTYFRKQDITTLPAHRIASMGISRTFQLAKLFYNLPVIENVMTARHLTRKTGFLGSLVRSRRYRDEERQMAEEASELLKLVRLQSAESHMARDLPYGSQRLLTLAIALSSDPKLLLIDEPTAGMNQEEAGQLASILRQINQKGISIFLVEHNMKFVMGLVERLVVLNHGQVICEGTPDEVRNDSAVIDAYLGGGFQCTSK